jgi:uncharacterized protein (DUF1499 family)
MNWPRFSGLNMNNLSPKQLSLYICILMSATHAAAGLTTRPDKFSPCAGSPNCVSSQSTDKARFIEPLHYAGSLADARQKLIDVLKNTKRVRLVKVETDYIHAEFRSAIFQFADDVEFYFPPDQAIIHVKSASRIGYYDFGANRRRVEWLRAIGEKNHARTY